MYNLWRQQSNFLGIINEDAIGAIFLLDKCRQGLQVGAFCCHPKFDLDRDSHSSGMSENEVHFRAAPYAIAGGRPGNALHGGGAVNSLSGSTSTVVESVSGGVNSLSGSTSTVVDSVSGAVNLLSGSTSTVVDSVSGAVNSLSGSTSTVVNSLSTVVVDNTTKADLNTIYGLAGMVENLASFGALTGVDGGGVSLTGAAFTSPTTENVTAYAERERETAGVYTAFANASYGASNILWGYSPDTSFTTTPVDVTLNGGTEYNGTGGSAVGWSLLGGSGADSIIGSADIDTALGGNENDTINGGGGADSLDGGADDDLFLFSTRATFAAVGNGGATA